MVWKMLISCTQPALSRLAVTMFLALVLRLPSMLFYKFPASTYEWLFIYMMLFKMSVGRLDLDLHSSIANWYYHHKKPHGGICNL